MASYPRGTTHIQVLNGHTYCHQPKSVFSFKSTQTEVQNTHPEIKPGPHETGDGTQLLQSESYGLGTLSRVALSHYLYQTVGLLSCDTAQF